MALWRVEEAAEYLGIRPKTLYEWVRLDRVPYRKIGFNVRFDPEELERWTRDQSGGAGDANAARKDRGSAPRRKRSDRSKRADASAGTPNAGPSPAATSVLVRLAGDASSLLRDLERDVGTSLSFPQRRKLLELASRLDDAAAEARGS